MSSFYGGGGSSFDPSKIETIKTYICGVNQYSNVTGLPTILEPDQNTFYLVPGDNGYNEYYYKNGNWELFGSADNKFDLSDRMAKGVDNQGNLVIGAVIEGLLEDITGNFPLNKNIASGVYSHAEGMGTKSSGRAAHTEGYNTQASGARSHAEGQQTVASGSFSHAEGYGMIANHESQHVFGEFNIEDSSVTATSARGNYIEIVGNGSSNNRSNARTLDWNGNEVLAGKLTVGAAPTNDMDVATKKYVDDNVGDEITALKTDLDELVEDIFVAGRNGYQHKTVEEMFSDGNLLDAVVYSPSDQNTKIGIVTNNIAWKSFYVEVTTTIDMFFDSSLSIGRFLIGKISNVADIIHYDDGTLQFVGSDSIRYDYKDDGDPVPTESNKLHVNAGDTIIISLGSSIDPDDVVIYYGENGYVLDRTILNENIRLNNSQIEQVKNNMFSDEVKVALLNCFAHVAWINEHGQDYYDVLEAALNGGSVDTLSAVVNLGTHAVYPTDNLQTLRDYLTVYFHSSGTTTEITEYTLQGDITSVGTHVLTITYNNLSTTVNITVEANITGILYEWDFTKSLTDSRQLQTAVLGTGEAVDIPGKSEGTTPPVRNATGIVFSDAQQFARLFSTDIITSDLLKNKTVEVDVASFDLQYTINVSYGMRFLMLSSPDTNGYRVFNCGLAYIRGLTSSYVLGWKPMSGAPDGTLTYPSQPIDTDISIINGHTVGVYFNNDGTIKMYIDGVSKGTSNVSVFAQDGCKGLQIGAGGRPNYGGCFYNALITGVRIYDGDVV